MQRLSIVVAVAAVTLLFKLITKQNIKKESHIDVDADFVVTLPKLYLWVGSISTLIFLGLSIATLAIPEFSATPLVTYLFMSFSLLSIIPVITSVYCQITVNEYSIIYRNALRKSFIIDYNTIENVVVSPNGIKIRYSVKSFSFDPYAVGKLALLQRLHNKDIPITYK